MELPTLSEWIVLGTITFIAINFLAVAMACLNDVLDFDGREENRK